MDELMFADNSEVTIVKANYQLKIKAGTGGFEPERVALAEKRLDEAAYLFPEAARPDLGLIEAALASIAGGQAISPKTLQTIAACCIELKSHSVMFQYPLATTVADSLLQFCNAVKATSPLISQVIALHLQALKIVIEQGAKANKALDHGNLLAGLQKASEKALRS